MQVISARNVCQALPMGLRVLSTWGDRESSRAGDVLVAPWPVTTRYQRPEERVLTDPIRDANPFFHLMESVWMLAGMRDARWLNHYVSDFSARYAEENGDCWGAYGHRWRRHFVTETEHDTGIGPMMDVTIVDQILEIGEMLRRDPTTRRCVLAMWDPAADLNADKKDLPCNTHVYFRAHHGFLDVTVCNRSNDIVWGAYGANAVHMSVMAEVVAGLAGLRLGQYYQVSNNYHVYTDVCSKMRFIAEAPTVDLYSSTTPVAVAPIVVGTAQSERTACAKNILEDADLLVRYRDDPDLTPTDFHTSWFRNEVMVMSRAHSLWKRGEKNEAAWLLENSPDLTDWKIAGLQWMKRRLRSREEVR